jgi:hypothetical protein
LAIQHAQNNTGFYDSSIRHDPIVWEIEGQVETDDFYEIRLSFRPVRGFHGQPGIENFTIDKTGKIELRQIVRELVREPASEPASQALSHEAPSLLTSTFPWKIVAGIAASLAVAIIIIWIVIGDGDDVVETVVADGSIATAVPELVNTPTPIPTPVLSTIDPIQISIASSITKWEWLEDAVAVFNEATRSDANFQVNGSPIQVEVLLEADSRPRHQSRWLGYGGPSRVGQVSFRLRLRG